MVHMMNSFPAVNVAALSVETLALECAEQSNAFRRSAQHTDAFCLELFRRAILLKAQDAWTAIYTQFHKVVLSWVCARLNCAEHPPEDIVHEAFLRFTRAFTSHRFRQYDQMKSIMAYLQRCAIAATYDYGRQVRRMASITESLDDEVVAERLVTSTDTVEQEIATSLEAEWVWTRVLSHCNGDADKLLVRCIFVEGIKPEQVHRDHTNLFPTTRAVYQAARNLRDRLRRDEALAAAFLR